MGNGGGFENREMRTYFNGLALRVQATHGARCPCCGSVMVKPRKKNDTNRRRRDRITVAHDAPVGYGGNPERWVYACQGCNADQGMRTFRVWSRELERRIDARARRVAALADEIDAYYGEVNAKNNVPACADRMAPVAHGSDVAAENLQRMPDTGVLPRL